MNHRSTRWIIAVCMTLPGVIIAGQPPLAGATGASGSTTVRLDAMADRVAAGRTHSCVILDSGDVTCWGDGSGGALGYGDENSIGDGETPANNPVDGGLVQLPGGRPATALTIGDDHTCALLDNGSVTCWGENNLGYGNTNAIGEDETPADNPVNGGLIALPGGRTATAIEAGEQHTCALLEDGNIACWGRNLEGQLGYGNTENIGDDETPADNPENGGLVPLPTGRTATAIAAGGNHTCALLDNGAVLCWGLNTYGALGYGNTNTIGDDETPATISPVSLPESSAVAITAGAFHTCAILASGAVSCWGLATDGQLGYGNQNAIGDNETPADNPVNGGIVELPNLADALSISAGIVHTCAVLADRTVTCWGYADDGELGYGNQNAIGDNETPADNPVDGGIVAMPSGLGVIALSAGGYHSCAVLQAGQVTCWGEGLYGRLGFGNPNRIGDNEKPSNNPVTGGFVSLPGQHGVAQISGGYSHLCALLDNGTVTCWGSSTFGQLGYGNTNDIGGSATPAQNPAHGGIVELPGGQTAVAIAAGDIHTCAILADGSVTCWGAAMFAQLGYGNTDSIGDDETPADNPVNGGIVELPGGRTAIAIDAGDTHTCVVLDDGNVACWGFNSDGQLGYGNTNYIGDDETPADNPVNGGIVPLPGGLKATAISVGNRNSCALLTDQTVTCWGANGSGQLGYGNTNAIGDTETPAANPVNSGRVALPAGRTARALSTGDEHTCALLDNGSITCWGLGAQGSLGYGNTNNIGDNETPATAGVVSLPGALAASAVVAGFENTCAILSNGTVACWGVGGSSNGYATTLAIGDNETPASVGVVSLPGGATALSMGAGYRKACAILAPNRSVTCWGQSNDGALGYGNTHAIGDDETPADNPVNGGILRLPHHLSAIDYRSLTPARLLDTRATGATIDDLFEAGGQRPAGSVLQLDVAGRGGVAADATSITLSVAAVQPTAGGFLTIWPCAAAQPNASSLNYAAGVNTANTVITGISGGVCIYTSQATQLIADVVGYTPRSSTLTSLTPARYLDTRPTGSTFDDQFEAGGQRPAASTLNVDIADRGAVPAGTRTVILNVAAVAPTASGFLTVWPCDQARPNASNLNYVSGTNTANLVIARAAPDGTVCIYTSQATQLIADVVGYFTDTTAPGPSLMHTVNPGRLVDTRPTGATTDNRYENSGLLVANATNTYQITNRIPLANANVAVLNITVVSPAANGFVTIWPCDQAKPNASSLNYITGTNRAVQVLTKLSTSGTVCVSSSQPTHLIIDATGSTM